MRVSDVSSRLKAVLRASHAEELLVGQQEAPVLMTSNWQHSNLIFFLFLEKKTLPSKMLFSDTFDSFPFRTLPPLPHSPVCLIYLPFLFYYLYLRPILLPSIGCTLLRLGEAGGWAGCAWAFYDPSSSSFHPVKCLTTINPNSPPWEIAATMRWVLICEGASRWSSVMPRASPTRRQREILI